MKTFKRIGLISALFTMSVLGVNFVNGSIKSNVVIQAEEPLKPLYAWDLNDPTNLTKASVGDTDLTINGQYLALDGGGVSLTGDGRLYLAKTIESGNSFVSNLQSFSVSFDYKIPTLSDHSDFVLATAGSYGGFQLHQVGKILRITAGDQYMVDEANPLFYNDEKSINEWVNIAVTANHLTKEVKLYIDGELLATRISSKDIRFNNNSQYTLCFNGQCDYNGNAHGSIGSASYRNIKLFDQVADDYTIKANYNETKDVLPIAYYKMDDASNLGKDSMGNYDMTIKGEINPLANGGALFKNGAQMYIAGNDNNKSKLSYLKSFSVSLDYKYQATTGNDFILATAGSYGNGFQLHQVDKALRVTAGSQYLVNSDDNLWYNGYVENAKDPHDNWMNVTITANSETKEVCLYVDGSLYASRISTGDVMFTADSCANYTFCLNGQCDYNGNCNASFSEDISYRNVRIFNSAIKASQVAKLTNKSELKPIVNYKFNNENNLLEDSMNNINLSKLGNATYKDNGVNLSGDEASLYIAKTNKDSKSFASMLNAFTFSFDYRVDDLNGKDFYVAAAGSYGGFQLHQVNNDLRITAGQQYMVVDGDPLWFNSNSYGGYTANKDWMNITVSANPSTKVVSLYINGRLYDRKTSALDVFFNNNDNYTLTLNGQGGLNGSAHASFTNDVNYRNVKLFDVELSEKQVASNFSNDKVYLEDGEFKEVTSLPTIQESTNEFKSFNEYLSILPSNVDVSYTDNTTINSKVLWTNLETIENTQIVHGVLINDVASANKNIKAVYKVLKNITDPITPLASWSLSNPSQIGNDTNDNFNFEVSGDITILDDGGITIKEGSKLFLKKNLSSSTLGDLINSFTFSFDYKKEDLSDSTDTYVVSAGCYGGFVLHQVGKDLRVTVGDQYCVFSIDTSKAKNDWIRISITANKDTKEVCAYIDGELKAKGTTTGNVMFANNENYTLCLNGQCDVNGTSHASSSTNSYRNVNLYDYVLNKTQVSDEFTLKKASISDNDVLKIKECEKIKDIVVPVGTSAQSVTSKLPKTIEVELEDSSKVTCNIIWTKQEEISSNDRIEGFVIKGRLIGNNIYTDGKEIEVNVTYDYSNYKNIKATPESWYKFEDTNFGKDSSNNNNLNIIGTIKTNTNEKGIYLDGESFLYAPALKDTNDFSDYLKSYTYSINFKRDDIDENQFLINSTAYGDGMGVFINNWISIYFGSNHELVINYKKGEWNHLVVTCNMESGYCAAYLNGALAAEDTFNPKELYVVGKDKPLYTFCIGGQCDINGTSSTGLFKGYVDDVRLYSFAASKEFVSGIFTDTNKEGVSGWFKDSLSSISVEDDIDFVIANDNTVEDVLAFLPVEVTIYNEDKSVSGKANVLWYIKEDIVIGRLYNCDLVNVDNIKYTRKLTYKIEAIINGKGIVSSEVVNKDDSVTLTFTPDNGYTLKEASYNNEILQANNENNSFTFIFDGKNMPNVTFSKIVYTLSCENTELDDVTFTVDDEITLTIPTKEGYTFEGYYLTSDFTGESVSVINKGTTTNITLYAKWSKNEEPIPSVEPSEEPSSEVSSEPSSEPSSVEQPISSENNEKTNENKKGCKGSSALGFIGMLTLIGALALKKNKK